MTAFFPKTDDAHGVHKNQAVFHLEVHKNQAVFRLEVHKNQALFHLEVH